LPEAELLLWADKSDTLNVELHRRLSLSRNVYGKKFLETFRLCVLYCIFSLVSCGIEDYVYLVPTEYVNSVGSTSARISIPDNSSSAEFRYYAIFYRIYISDQNIDSITTSQQRYTINHALASHYNAIDPYTRNDNISPSSVPTVFSSLKYYPLYVEVNSAIVSMSQILADNSSLSYHVSPGSVVELVFANSGPYLQISGLAGELPLRRSADGFTANPNRSFFNSTGTGSLSDGSIVSENSNADVETNPYMSFPDRHTYVSLYIAAAGIDKNFTAVYSRPKHIGVFRLP
jgi:hypothetical protein